MNSTNENMEFGAGFTDKLSTSSMTILEETSVTENKGNATTRIDPTYTTEGSYTVGWLRVTPDMRAERSDVFQEMRRFLKWRERDPFIFHMLENDCRRRRIADSNMWRGGEDCIHVPFQESWNYLHFRKGGNRLIARRGVAFAGEQLWRMALLRESHEEKYLKNTGEHRDNAFGIKK